MKKIFLLWFLLQALLCESQNISFDKKTYDVWLDMRVGNGRAPAIWYCYGEVYSYPEGKLISRMEGVDLARFLKIKDDSCVQISRKIFIYTDTATGQALETWGGKPVQHIQFPYQQISYVRKNNKLVTWVVQGTGDRIQTIGPGTKTLARKIGNTYVFSAPLFLNLTTTNGKYEAYENYDFFVNLSAKKTKDKYQLTWNRFGDMPSFSGTGKSIIQLICYRVDSFEELGEPLKKFIREKAPLWLDAPKDLEEIKKLQMQ